MQTQQTNTARHANRAQQREHDDPEENARAVPWGLVLLILGLFTWGVGYLASNRMSEKINWGDQRTLADVAAPVKSAVADGAAIFAAQCASCHQADGAGLPGVFPPLAGSEWVNGKPALVAQILLRVADPDRFAARVGRLDAEPWREDISDILLLDGRTLRSHSTALGQVGGERPGRVWYFRDVSDHLTTVNERVLDYDSLLSSMLDAATAKVGIQQNTDMRKITAWAAMAAAPTMIAGIYGMNFDHMPELHWRYGYFVVLAVMVMICALLWRTFRRHGWL